MRKPSNVKKENIHVSADPEVLAEFQKYAERLGIKVSTWVNAKMIEFNEEQRMLAEIRAKKALK